MMDGGVRAVFPVVFYDGEREMNIGNVQINPALEYKPFQLMLSQMIGISPNQISIYLVDRRRNLPLPFTEDHRRIPITGKVNFGLICRQQDCYFLVVLKRSRKSRNRRERIGDGVEFSDYVTGNEFPPPPVHLVPENLTLLRRDQLSRYDQITQPELSVLNSRLQNLKLQRESFLLAMARGDSNPPNFHSSRHRLSDLNLTEYFGVPSSVVKNDGGRILCSECVKEKNAGTPSFHACVHDPVITRSATRFGPPSRPEKPFPWKLYKLFPSERKKFIF